eukprot:1157706-Pelagomonas_calceolata.AAC.1
MTFCLWIADKHFTCCASLQNAYTSADETCYQLVVPTDSPQLLADALRVMAQFAFKIRWGSSLVASLSEENALWVMAQ